MYNKYSSSRLTKFVAVSLGFSVAAFSPFAQAVDKTWNNTGTDFNTPGNWSPSLPTAPDRAIFGPAAQSFAPNVSSDITIHSLLFSGTGYTLSSSNQTTAKLTLATGGASGTAISIASGGTGPSAISSALVLGQGAGNTATFAFSTVTNSSLSLSGNISESGAGTRLSFTSSQITNAFTLSGDNSYTGGTGVLNNMTLNLNSATAIGSGALLLTNTFTLDNASAGAITLSNNNNLTYTAGTTTFAGTRDLSFGSGTLSLNANMSLAVNASTLTIGSINADTTARTFTKTGAGTLAISNAAGVGAGLAFQGASTISAGTILLGNKTALGTGAIALNGATLSASADLSGSGGIANAFTFTSGSIIAGANNIELSGLSVGSSRTLVNNISTAGTAKLTLSNSSILIGTGANTAATFTINGSGNALISGNLLHNAGTALSGLAYSGTGTLTLTPSTANTYTGLTTVNGGTLKIGVNNAIPTGAGNGVTVATNVAGGTATLDLNGFNQTLGALSMGGATGASATSVANVIGSGSTLTNTGGVIFTATGAPLGSTISVSTLDLNGATQTFNVGDSATATNDLTVSSVVQNGGINKTGAGTLLLSGSGNTYAGGTTVSGGTLAAGQDTSFGSGAINVTGTSTIQSSGVGDRTFSNDYSITATTGNTTTANLGTPGTGKLAFGAYSGAGTGGTRVLAINNTQTSFTHFNGTLGVNTTGTGALFFSGDWTSTGGLNIGNSNIVGFAGTIPTSATAPTISLSGGGVVGWHGTLSRILGTTGSANRLNFTGSGGFAGYGGAAGFGGANNLNFSFTAARTFGEANFLANGQALVLGNALANGTVDFQTNLNLNGATQTVKVDRSNIAAASDIDGQLSGAITNGSLTKTGSGVLSLTGNSNTYAGGTSISAGTLLANNTSGSATGSGAILVSISGTLGGTGSVSGATNVDGALAPGNSPGSLEFGAALTLASTADFNVELAGTTFTLNATEEYDRIKVTGLSSLDGDLNVSLINGFTLASGQLFGIVDAVGGLTGAFANFAEGTTILSNSGFELKITYLGLVGDSSVAQTGGNDVVLFSVVPEPSTFGMLLGFGVLLGFQRARRGRKL